MLVLRCFSSFVARWAALRWDRCEGVFVAAAGEDGSSSLSSWAIISAQDGLVAVVGLQLKLGLNLWDRSEVVGYDGDVIREETSPILSSSSIAVDVAMMGMYMLMVLDLLRPTLLLVDLLIILADTNRREENDYTLTPLSVYGMMV